MNDKYYSLFNQIADPIFIFDKENCQILDCNQAVTRIYGYTHDEICAMTFFDLNPANEQARVKKAIKIVNKDVPFTFTHFKKNGVKIIVEILSDRIDYEGKQATISIVRDVSDRVKIEKELERRASQATLIYAIGKRFSSYLDLETVLTEIVNSINDTFDFYGVMLFLLNERKKRLELQSIAGGYAAVFPSTLSIKLSEGMIGNAVIERRTQLSGDVTTNPFYVRKAEEATVSELAVPIMKNEQVIGVLDFQSDKKDAFDKQDVELAETLSSQIATAIENARLYREAQREIAYSKKLESEAKRRATQFSLLYQIGQKVSSELDLENLLQAIVVNIRDAFEYYGVMLLLLDREKQNLSLQSIAGAYAGIFPVDLTIKVGEGMIGQAALTQQTQLCNDTTNNPHYVRKADEITSSELSVPIMKGEVVIGVLDFQSDTVNAFDESDVTAAETLSSQIAGAIENARLYNQAQNEIEERLKAEAELIKSRNSLRAAKRQTDNILQNVAEGFFLLDKKFRISVEHSAALCDILEMDQPAQRYLPEVLQSMTSDTSTGNVIDFLELMFNPAIEEQTLMELNPLTEVSVKIRKENELLTKDKVLSFRFQRILNEKEIIGIIATVVDISEKVRLARKLEESEEQAKLQMEWFMGILHVEPPLLKEFIDSANHELKQIEKAFRDGQKQNDFKELLDTVYRSVHMIKGNASLLDLKFFANRSHAFEESIEEVKQKLEITAKDFIPLVLQLNEMRKNINEITKMIERISLIHAHFRPKRSYENKLLLNSLKNLIKSLSQDLKKKVQFEYSAFDLNQLPYEYRLLVKDLMVQMVRNSMTHGIESVEERKKRKKPVTGKIEINNFFENGYFCFTYKDDGRGLQLKKLKESAENSGRWGKQKIAAWSDQQLADLIYEPGLSTCDKVDLTAGRGVGMDIIKKKIISHQGQILMNFDEGKFLEFTVKLPVNRN